MTPHEIWEQIMPPQRRWLGLIIFASLLVHMAGFLVFRIDPVKTRAYADRPRQFKFIDPRLQSEGAMGDNWTQWLDWRDPTSIALPWTPLQEPSMAEVELPAVGTENAMAPPPKPFALPRDLPATLSQQADRLITGTPPNPMPIRVESPPPLSGTTFRTEGKLAERKLLSRPGLPQPRTDLSLKITVLGIGVDRSGAVISAVVEESCGDGTVDQSAVQAVQGWMFNPRSGGAESDWGRVSIFWDLNEKLAPATPKQP
ncbi:MAG: TonB family protein [Candidatus Methylacidiphilales bacterium]|nr:TonB family protein [Candidatus Methylacidiphilales bacterium]